MDPTSNISRWVAFLVAPFATLAGGFIALKSQQWFGLTLDPAEATAYVTGVILSISGFCLLWLRNRGRFEIAELFGTTPGQVDQIIGILAEKLPPAPTAPNPGVGSPESPRAPGS